MEQTATKANWQISGPAFGHCNCAWGCPCQFNALPTSGQCEALWAMRIEQGHFNGTQLNGLVWGGLYWWPGAVHEGNGKQQIFYDKRATEEQRRALDAIAGGQASVEGTWFQILAAMAPDFQPPVAAAIEFDCDLKKRAAHLVVPDLVDARAEPIRNPVTNAEHRARVTMPEGFEYREAEYASGTSRTQGNAAVSLDLNGTHAHLYQASWNANGIVEA